MEKNEKLERFAKNSGRDNFRIFNELFLLLYFYKLISFRALLFSHSCLFFHLTKGCAKLFRSETVFEIFCILMRFFV